MTSSTSAAPRHSLEDVVGALDTAQLHRHPRLAQALREQLALPHRYESVVRAMHDRVVSGGVVAAWHRRRLPVARPVDAIFAGSRRAR